MALPLSTEAMQALMFFVENSTHSTQQLSPGLYWKGAFYSGVGKYHVFKTCNSWVSQGLRAAGVASAPGSSVLSSGLLWDLRLRYPDRGKCMGYFDTYFVSNCFCCFNLDLMRLTPRVTAL
ncbi:MAG: DUF2459 domain-containing protein [Shimia sp.]